MFILCNVVKNIYIGEEVLYFRAMRVYGIVNCKIQKTVYACADTHRIFRFIFFAFYDYTF